MNNEVRRPIGRAACAMDSLTRVYPKSETDAYIDSIERQAMFTIADLNKRDAMRVERIGELTKALKACHLQLLQSNNDSEYAREASEMAMAALNAQPTQEGE